MSSLVEILSDIEARIQKVFGGYREDGFLGVSEDGVNLDVSKLPSYTYHAERLANIQKKGATFDVFTKTVSYRVVIAETVDFASGETLSKKARVMTAGLFEAFWKVEASYVEDDGEYAKGLAWGTDIEVMFHQNKYVLVSGVLGVNIEHDPRSEAVGKVVKIGVVV